MYNVLIFTPGGSEAQAELDFYTENSVGGILAQNPSIRSLCPATRPLSLQWSYYY